jgi:hypothetical protein
MAGPKHDCQRVRALAAVTVNISGYGMVPMDPDSEREELRFPLVPKTAIEGLVRMGRIADDVEEDESKAAAKPVAAKRAKAAAKPVADAEAAPDAGNGANAGDEAPAS